MKNRLVSSFTIVFTVLGTASGDSCKELRESAGTLRSQATANSLEQAGYFATFNGLLLSQLDGVEIPVDSSYIFEISHSDVTMQNVLMEFELDWSSMVHSKFSKDTFRVPGNRQCILT